MNKQKRIWYSNCIVVSSARIFAQLKIHTFKKRHICPSFIITEGLFVVVVVEVVVVAIDVVVVNAGVWEDNVAELWFVAASV